MNKNGLLNGVEDTLYIPLVARIYMYFSDKLNRTKVIHLSF